MRSLYHPTDPRYHIDGLRRTSDPPESADSSHSDIATHDDSLADRDQTSVSCYARVKLARSTLDENDRPVRIALVGGIARCIIAKDFTI